MAAKLTPTRQRNAVSEGVAFGLIMLGYGSVGFEKWRVDLAFTAAWRNWPRAHEFPQVNTDISKGLDGAAAMTRASEGKHTIVFYWDRSNSDLEIVTRLHDWDSGDPKDVDFAACVIGGDLTVNDWLQLAQLFVDKMAR